MLSIYEDGRCYDLIYPAKPKESVFWIGVARDFANTGPILETGCGTGYVCLPLAQAGYNACGLDLSASMLDEARRKAQVLGLEVDLLEHDMRSFDLGRQFSLILLPANAFGHLLTRQDQISYLDGIRRHLAPGGHFVLSMFVPDTQWLLRRDDEEKTYGRFTHPDTDKPVHVTYTYEFDIDTQIKRHRLYSYHGESKESELGHLDLRVYFPQKLHLLA